MVWAKMCQKVGMPYGTSSGNQIFFFDVSLESSRCFHLVGMVHDVNSETVCRQGCFLSSFSLFSLIILKFTLVIQNFRVILLFIEISTSILILLIFNFCSWAFY